MGASGAGVCERCSILATGITNLYAFENSNFSHLPSYGAVFFSFILTLYCIACHIWYTATYIFSY